MTVAGLSGRTIGVHPESIDVVAARLDRVAASLRVMSGAANGSLARAAPDVGDPNLGSVCVCAAAASRIRLAGLGDWSTLLAGRLRQTLEAYAATDATAARLLTAPSPVGPT
jgi:hypothetical protein